MVFQRFLIWWTVSNLCPLAEPIRRQLSMLFLVANQEMATHQADTDIANLAHTKHTKHIEHSKHPN